ncbi:MAG TPA: chromate transporter [Lachnospiraceae bacterium]|nr:chromate transporter [Lachnospiraceae bacterium]
MTLFFLFLEFFQTGLFAVGGGLATLPFLYKMAEDHPDWLDASQIMDMLAVSESTPGAIGVNMSTYVGYNTAGVLGAVIGTFGLVLPSVVIVLAVAKVLNAVKENKNVQNVFFCIRPASMALIASAGLTVMKNAFLATENGFSVKWLSVLFGVILFVLMRKTKKHPVLYIAIAAAAGCVIGF